ncbi:MAG: hypothetical protein ACXQTZ_01945 [Candidatus Alkanophagales archaeon]
MRVEFERERVVEGEREFELKPVEFEEEAERLAEAVLERVAEMSDAERQDLSDELLGVVTASGAELDRRAANALMALVKGHHTAYAFRNAIEACMRVAPDETREVLKRYV